MQIGPEYKRRDILRLSVHKRRRQLGDVLRLGTLSVR